MTAGCRRTCTARSRYPQGLVAFLAGLGDAGAHRPAVRRWARKPAPLDRGIAFGVLAVAALVGIVLWAGPCHDAPAGLLPDRAYGFWIAAIAAIVLARAAFEISQEPPRR